MTVYLGSGTGVCGQVWHKHPAAYCCTTSLCTMMIHVSCDSSFAALATVRLNVNIEMHRCLMPVHPASGAALRDCLAVSTAEQRLSR